MSYNQWGNPGPQGAPAPRPMGQPGPYRPAPMGPQGPPGPGFPAYAPGPAPGPKKKATPIVLIVVITVVAVIGGIAGVAAWAARDTPKKGVERYFASLSSSFRNGLVGVVVNVPSASELRDAESFAAGQRGTYTVDKVVASGHRAKVEYTIDGRKEQVDMQLRKVEGRFKVVDGFSKLTLNSPSNVGLTLGRHDIRNLTGKTVTLYPGTYELRPSIRSGISGTYWEFKNSADKTVTLKPGERRMLDVQTQLTSDGVYRARQAVGLAFSRCLNSSDAAPADCPFSVEQPADKGPSARWRSSGDSYRITAKSEVDGSQPLDAVCTSFTAQVDYEYYTPDYRDKRSIRAPQEKFTGCLDFTESSRRAVSWK